MKRKPIAFRPASIEVEAAPGVDADALALEAERQINAAIDAVNASPELQVICHGSFLSDGACG